MSKPPDDLEAVRTLIETLKPFDAEGQERIIRWTREKLGLPTSPQVPAQEATLGKAPPPRPQPLHATQPGLAPDIKTFVTQKNPTSDNQLAATVTYYYRFEAPEAERKESISGDDLQEACRKAGRPRLKNPGKTLRNAHGVGLLDRAADRGSYSINTVGENLVAMTLPGGETPAPGQRRGPENRVRGRCSPRRTARR